MNTLDLNAYGVEKMTLKEMENTDGGFVLLLYYAGTAAVTALFNAPGACLATGIVVTAIEAFEKGREMAY